VRPPTGHPFGSIGGARPVVAGLLAGGWLLAHAAMALGASPDPTPIPAGGDPRSAGQGPGLVGDPLAAVLVVALIALVSLGATLAYVRATGGPRDDAGGR
jgi:hypothetical protein